MPYTINPKLTSKGKIMQKLLLKFALLSASFILVTAYSISVCLPDYTRIFSDYSSSAVEFLVTVHAFAIVAVMFIANPLANFLGKKNMIMLGLITIAFSSILAFYAKEYMVMLFARIIYGIGLGLINALAISMISDFFSGNECATLLGFRNATEGLGQSVLVAIAGFIYINIGYDYVPLVYLCTIPILIVFFLFIPNDKRKNTTPKTVQDIVEANYANTQSHTKNSLPFNSSLHCLILFFTVAIFTGFFVKMYEVLAVKNLSDAKSVSIILTTISLATMLGGILFGPLYIKLKFNLLPLTYLVTAATCVFMCVFDNLNLLIIVFAIYGACYTIVIVYMFNLIPTLATNTTTIIVTAAMIIGCNIGAFISPLIFVVLGKLISSDIIINILAFACIYVIIASTTLVYKSKFIQKA